MKIVETGEPLHSGGKFTPKPVQGFEPPTLNSKQPIIFNAEIDPQKL